MKYLTQSLIDMLQPTPDEPENRDMFARLKVKRASTIINTKLDDDTRNKKMIKKMCRVAILLFFMQCGFKNSQFPAQKLQLLIEREKLIKNYFLFELKIR